jgi:hypothetical protein
MGRKIRKTINREGFIFLSVIFLSYSIAFVTPWHTIITNSDTPPVALQP